MVIRDRTNKVQGLNPDLGLVDCDKSRERLATNRVPLSNNYAKTSVKIPGQDCNSVGLREG